MIINKYLNSIRKNIKEKNYSLYCHNTIFIVNFYNTALIILAKVKKHFKCFLIAKYLNKARNIHIIITIKKSIPKDCKHPINQYFWEYLYTEQKEQT